MSTTKIPAPVERTRSVAQQTFRNHLDFLSRGRIAEWVDLFTDDGVVEFPYAPDGYPSKVFGRARLREYMDNFPEQFRVDFVDLRFHETVDPSLVIAEFRSQGIARATGRPYGQTYISVVETVDGKIAGHVDFWNPQVAEKALSSDETPGNSLAAAFGSPS